jgi:hypothetical protein
LRTTFSDDTNLCAGAALTVGFSLGPAGTSTSDAGVAAAMVNSSNQIGGRLGAALLNSLAVGTVVLTQPTFSSNGATAIVHGGVVAFTVLTGILVAGAMLTALLHRPLHSLHRHQALSHGATTHSGALLA